MHPSPLPHHHLDQAVSVIGHDVEHHVADLVGCHKEPPDGREIRQAAGVGRSQSGAAAIQRRRFPARAAAETRRRRRRGLGVPARRPWPSGSRSGFVQNIAKGDCSVVTAGFAVVFLRHRPPCLFCAAVGEPCQPGLEKASNT